MKNELAFHDVSDAMEVASHLIKNNYVVMLSREENLTILNYVWAPDANRNYVVFGDYEDFEPVREEE